MRIANVTSQAVEIQWPTVDWRLANAMVNNLRHRIYRASARGNLKSAKSLQRLMLKSRCNRLVSIRRVTQQNHGKHTPGVDGVVIGTDKERAQLYKRITKTISIKASPVKRVYIPKKNGKKRPLGLPTIIDRCYQAIVKNALEPYWEAKFESVSYGFRPGRSVHDAMQKIHCIARAGKSRHWVLDADIRNAFDKIDHGFLMNALGAFPARNLIHQWLKSGVMEEGLSIATEAGTPQGGIISPLLANIALHGMENSLGITYWKNGTVKQDHPYALVRYADDFVVFAKTKNDCERAKELLQTFLEPRGLQLAEDKTRVCHLREGFDFLGFNIRHYSTPWKKRGYVCLMRPSRESVSRYIRQMKQIWKSVVGRSTKDAIHHLNQKVIGWVHYFKSGASKRTFSRLDHWMYLRQVRYLYRRHPDKHWWWKRKNYFGVIKGRLDRWVFKDIQSGTYLWKHAWTKIKRHVLVKGNASPDDPSLKEYWKQRQAKTASFIYGVKPVLSRRQRGVCPICWQPLNNGEPHNIHHIVPLSKEGSRKLDNICLVHGVCHRQIHSKLGKYIAEVIPLLEPYAG